MGVAATATAAALFVPEPEPNLTAITYCPTIRTEGPWDATAMHGGPPSGLLARTVERFDAGDGTSAADWFVSRLTIELLRPIPIRPIRITSRLSRPGRRVQLVDASLWSLDGTVELARVTALRIRRQRNFALPTTAHTANAAHDDARRPMGQDDPASVGEAPKWRDGTGFYHLGADVRSVVGSFSTPGPGTIWVRLRQPLVLGEVDTPLIATATMADLTNASASSLPPGTHAHPNADLTISRLRDQTGEWMGLSGVSRISEEGIGLVVADLFDVDGVIGQSAASLVVSALP